MRVLEIDRRAHGTPDAFTEPPPGARAAIPKLDKAMQKRDSLIQKQTELMFEAQRLRDGLPAAREHDRVQAAEAAELGEPCPPSTEEAPTAEAAKKSRLAIALVDKINQAQGDVTRLITRDREKFTRELHERTAQHAAEYELAISRIEQARARLAEDVIIGAWLENHPNSVPQPNVMQIPQPEELEDQPPRMWPHVLADLRRDAGALPRRGPLVVSDKNIERHRAFVAQEGGHNRWFKGGTEVYWDVHDTIARIEAGITETT